MSIAKAGKSVVGNTNAVLRPTNIGKAKLLKDDLDLDFEDDEKNDGYSIEPAVPLWKTIDFRGKTQQQPNSTDPSPSSRSNLLGSNSATTLPPSAMFGGSSSAKGGNGIVQSANGILSSGVSPLISPNIQSSSRGSGIAKYTSVIETERLSNASKSTDNEPTSYGSMQPPLSITLSPVRAETYQKMYSTNSGSVRNMSPAIDGGSYDTDPAVTLSINISKGLGSSKQKGSVLFAPAKTKEEVEDDLLLANTLKEMEHIALLH